MKKIILYLLMSFTLFCADKQISTKYFKIFYPENLEEQAKLLYKEADKIAKKEFDFYNYKFKKKFTIVLRDNQDVENANAIYQTINLYPNLISTFSSEKNYENWISYVLSHELTHSILTNNINGALNYTFTMKVLINSMLTPMWMQEGLAVYSESKFLEGGRAESPKFNMKLKAELYTKKFKGLSLAGNYDYNPWYSYVYGYNFMNFIEKEYGEEALRESVDYFSRHQLKGAYTAFNKKTEKNKKNLNLKWKNYLKEKYPLEKNLVEGKKIEKKSGKRYNLLLRDKKLYYYANNKIKFPTEKNRSDIFSYDLTSQKFNRKFVRLKRRKVGDVEVGFDVGEEKLYFSRKIPNFLEGNMYTSTYEKKIDKLSQKYLGTKRIISLIKTKTELLYTYRKDGSQGLKDFSENEYISEKEGFSFEKFFYTNETLYFSAAKKNELGNYIYNLDLKTKKIEKICEGNSPFLEGKTLYFSRVINGTNNIIRKNLDTLKEYQITSVNYGAFEPIIYEEDLYYFNYIEKGHSLYKLDKQNFLNKELVVVKKQEKNLKILKSKDFELSEEKLKNKLNLRYALYLPEIEGLMNFKFLVNLSDEYFKHDLTLMNTVTRDRKKSDVEEGVYFNSYSDYESGFSAMYFYKKMEFPLLMLYTDYGKENSFYANLNLNLPIFEKKIPMFFMNSLGIDTDENFYFNVGMPFLGYIYSKNHKKENLNEVYLNLGLLNLSYYFSEKEVEITDAIYRYQLVDIEDNIGEKLKYRFETDELLKLNSEFSLDLPIELGNSSGSTSLKKCSLDFKLHYFKWEKEEIVLDYSTTLHSYIFNYLKLNMTLGRLQRYEKEGSFKEEESRFYYRLSFFY